VIRLPYVLAGVGQAEVFAAGSFLVVGPGIIDPAELAGPEHPPAVAGHLETLPGADAERPEVEVEPHGPRPSLVQKRQAADPKINGLSDPGTDASSEFPSGDSGSPSCPLPGPRLE